MKCVWCEKRPASSTRAVQLSWSARKHINAKHQRVETHQATYNFDICNTCDAFLEEYQNSTMALHWLRYYLLPLVGILGILYREDMFVQWSLYDLYQPELIPAIFFSWLVVQLAFVMLNFLFDLEHAFTVAQVKKRIKKEPFGLVGRRIRQPKNYTLAPAELSRTGDFASGQYTLKYYQSYIDSSPAEKANLGLFIQYDKPSPMGPVIDWIQEKWTTYWHLWSIAGLLLGGLCSFFAVDHYSGHFYWEEELQKSKTELHYYQQTVQEIDNGTYPTQKSCAKRYEDKSLAQYRELCESNACRSPSVITEREKWSRQLILYEEEERYCVTSVVLRKRIETANLAVTRNESTAKENASDIAFYLVGIIFSLGWSTYSTRKWMVSKQIV